MASINSIQSQNEQHSGSAITSANTTRGPGSRRPRIPYAWLGAGAVTLGVGAALAGAGAASADTTTATTTASGASASSVSSHRPARVAAHRPVTRVQSGPAAAAAAVSAKSAVSPVSRSSSRSAAQSSPGTAGSRVRGQAVRAANVPVPQLPVVQAWRAGSVAVINDVYGAVQTWIAGLPASPVRDFLHQGGVSVRATALSVVGIRVGATPSCVSTGNCSGQDFSNQDLTALYARKVNFTGANFTGTTLTDAQLQEAVLKSAILYHADLTGAQLSWAQLDQDTDRPGGGPGVDLRGANLTGTHFTSANLDHADLRGANVTGTDLRGADMGFANLHGVYLTSGGPGMNLTGANLSQANLSYADLTYANLTFADYATGYVGTRLNNTDLSHANLSYANFYLTSLLTADFAGATWYQTTCPNGTVTDTGCTA